MELKGTIKSIGQTQSFGDNGFRKRELVLTTDEQYPQSIMLEFVQDKCDVLNSYQVGQSVEVGINIRGREWVNPQGETKYFTSIQGWRYQWLNKVNQYLLPVTMECLSRIELASQIIEKHFPSA